MIAITSPSHSSAQMESAVLWDYEDWHGALAETFDHPSDTNDYDIGIMIVVAWQLLIRHGESHRNSFQLEEAVANFIQEVQSPHIMISGVASCARSFLVKVYNIGRNQEAKNQIHELAFELCSIQYTDWWANLFKGLTLLLQAGLSIINDPMVESFMANLRQILSIATSRDVDLRRKCLNRQQAIKELQNGVDMIKWLVLWEDGDFNIQMLVVKKLLKGKGTVDWS